MKKIFVINGSGGVGKDTFIDVVSSFVPSVFQTSSVDPAKTLATQVGWQGGKTEKDRKFLSDLKDLLTEYNDYPMQFLTERVKTFRASDKDIMFIHVREPREIEKAVKAFGANTVLITAEGRVAPIKSNHADNGVYDYTYDFYVDNSGTLDDLSDAVVGFLTHFCIPIPEGV